MKNFFKVVTLAVAMASSSLVSAAQDVQKIAVVFPSKIMHQSPQLEKIKKKLDAEFKGRFEELKTLEKEISAIDSKLKRDAELMPADEATALTRKREVKLSEYKLKGKAFEEDQRSRYVEEQQKASRQVRNVINEVALNEGYDLILNGEQIVFAKPELDISDIVIKEISKK
jgi:outer membrane protein